MWSRSLRAAVWGCVALAALVWNFPTCAAERNAPQQAGERAFVEFRARSGPDLVGHSFIVYGRLDAQGRIIDAHVAGLYTSDENYWIGMFIPLPASVGREIYDVQEPSAVVYRRYVTAGELREIKAGVARVRAIQHTWHLLFFNCNDFTGEMAELIHLRRPPSLMLPVAYVALLGAMNGPQSD